MQINPDEITSILKSRIEGLDTSSADLTEVGTVLSVADGIARVHGLENCMSFEMLDLPHGVTGTGAEPRVRQRRRRAVRRVGEDRRGRHGAADQAPARHPRRRGAAGPDRRSAGQPARRQGRDRLDRDPARGAQGPGRRPAPAGQGADADRTEGDRLDDPDRPGPARADHRRPSDREDGDRDRHDHQQQGSRPDLRVRRDRAAQVDGRAARRTRSRTPARWTTRSSSWRQPTRPRRSSSWRPTRAARWPSTSSTTARPRWRSTTTSPSTPTPTARCRCCCAVRRAARPIRVTSSTCTRGCSSAPSSCLTTSSTRAPETSSQAVAR